MARVTVRKNVSFLHGAASRADPRAFVKSDRSSLLPSEEMQIATLPTVKASEARERLLRTASGIFYAEGINSVGVDYIVAAAKVTRATFYRHFPSKDDLVLAYLQAAHDAIEARMAELGDLAAITDDICAQVERPGFSGCAFISNT